MKKLRMAAAAAASVLCAHAPARAEGCEVVRAAIIKMIHTPARMTTSAHLPDGKVLTMVSIHTGGKIYERLDGGKWTIKPDEPGKQEAELVKQNDRDKDRVCKLQGQETAGGQLADLYLERDPGIFVGRGETRTWISPASGLPVKAEIPFGTSITVITYAYDGIAPPAPGK